MRMFGAILILLSFSLPSYATDFEAAIFKAINDRALQLQQDVNIQADYGALGQPTLTLPFNGTYNEKYRFSYSVTFDLSPVPRNNKKVFKLLQEVYNGKETAVAVYRPPKTLTPGFHLLEMTVKAGGIEKTSFYLYRFASDKNYEGETDKKEIKEAFKKLQKGCEKARSKSCYFMLDLDNRGRKKIKGFMHGRLKIYSEQKSEMVAAEIPKITVNGKQDINWENYLPPKGPVDKAKMPYTAYLFNFLPYGDLFEQYSWNKYIIKGDKVYYYGGLNAQEKEKPINIELVIDEKNWRVVSGRFFLMDGVYCECDFQVEYNKEGLASRQTIEKWTTDGIYEKAVINFSDYRDEGFKFRIPGFNI